MRKAIKSLIKRQHWWYAISDHVIYQRLRSRDRYDSFLEEIAFYESFIGKSNKLIFDVGANVGSKSRVFSLLSERVVLFEPDLENLKILNARLKNISRCVIIDCALSSNQSVATYYSIGNDSAYNSLSEKHINTIVKTRNILTDERQFSQYEVNTSTLDFFIDKYGVPDYIKIDVEGYEKEVIGGLNVLVPMIGVEANLPEFLPETIAIINYLEQLSNGAYLFNYAINNSFKLKEFVNATIFKNELLTLSVKSIEVYCQLLMQ
jgi:FkbM family methyltransferase